MVQSVETIWDASRNNDNLSDWSVVWSTSHVPGMDTATGAGSFRRRRTGRRRLRIASLSFCSFLAMHCHVHSAALTGGFGVFMILVILSIAILANPLRHFEVYLGQWSISGPGRAFRIIPMFDGIGIATCVHAFLRAILSVVLGGLTGIYVMHSISDENLPFAYCRHMNLSTYKPEKKFVDTLALEGGEILETLVDNDGILQTSTVSVKDQGWRKAHFDDSHNGTSFRVARRAINVCNEVYDDYPLIYRTPQYNYFYVEVIHYRKDHSFKQFNMTLLYFTLGIWGVIWLLLNYEKLAYGRIIWNNMQPWFCGVPWVWSGVLLMTGLITLFSKPKNFRNTYKIGGNRDVLGGIVDSLMIAVYIHGSGLGTELIHGKGLNYYASGHIDPNLNAENLWHSVILTLLTAASTAAADICALSDVMQMRGVNNVQESSLWIIPMYSKCASQSGRYTHIITTIVFSSLSFSYIAVAYVCFKTALHIIFEYRVKLVFVEQLIVVAAVVFSALLTVPFVTNAGLPLLEALDSLLLGIAMPFICLLETFGLVYLYRSHDFVSDINIATEDNMCASRFGIQWQITPFICAFILISKICLVVQSELPKTMISYAAGALCILIVTVPIRAVVKACHFAKRRRG